MRILSILRLSCLAILSSFLFSCNEKEEFTTAKMEEYMPLTPGKYITYRLDSLVSTAFNASLTVKKYQLKYVIDALITDNLGRPSYRVYKYIRDSVDANSWTPAQPWTSAGTIQITPLSDQIELTEDNLRVIKMHMPITDKFTWKGNKFIPTSTCGLSTGAYCTLYSFSNDDNMDDWDFFYDGNPTTFSYQGNTYNDVLTVEQVDESINVPVLIPTAFGSKSRAVERYAKNIGLVFRHYEIWEYQPDRNPGGPNNTYVGFGVTQWMIDHN